ncbi:MAG TPA: bifunctional alpha,alpha-trehalose-phosphate synthase (UDP-forming)/trehalose-phosphatase, partial [Candidatus Binatia bacterium]|nr:bifunctional alpha,alpha-trehalose-phosphate synthase (UDP-forming)/trehalose-phosphatase [Candidatus Binatia bacterium]
MRLLLVAHRLPCTVRVVDGNLDLVASPGGVATGLAGAHRDNQSLWVGWPGPLDGLDEATRASLRAQLAEARLVPVELSPEEERGAYEGYANAVLWPLFHYEANRLPLDVRDFDVYRSVNERFADVVASLHQPGDVIWIHDYQLFLVPQLLRRRIPDAKIGFFLHIPFPSSEVFRTLPHRDAVLEGLLAADLVGFHTAAYMRHFVSAVQRSTGEATDIDRIRHEGRDVHIGVFPMGIDARAFATTASDPVVLREAFALQRTPEDKLLLGIDRLDYTKGIPRRLLAFERLLERHPEWRGQVRLVQIAVPSREGVEAYQEFRSKADELIGRIHGAFATPDWVPVHWIYRSLSHEEVVALYRAADVMLVTPLRDGMNLVAKEYVASRTDDGGVLVLSEFAGAASQLAEAILVNPYDVDATADAFHRALTMPEEESRRRMRAMRRRVFAFDAALWVERFVSTLASIEHAPGFVEQQPSTFDVLEQAGKELRASDYLVLLIDYDGTLVPLTRTPALAAPDPEARQLLTALCHRPETEVHVVSGRSADDLHRWLGDLPVGLHAEHGIYTRSPGAHDWAPCARMPHDWREPVLAILHEFTERTPGTLIEKKGACVVWHYRAAEPEFAAQQARELRLHLLELLSNQPVEVLSGRKALEIRPQGFHKGHIVEQVRDSAPLAATIVA